MRTPGGVRRWPAPGPCPMAGRARPVAEPARPLIIVLIAAAWCLCVREREPAPAHPGAGSWDELARFLPAPPQDAGGSAASVDENRRYHGVMIGWLQRRGKIDQMGPHHRRLGPRHKQVVHR